MGTCIGERNYRQFCIFVFSTAAVLLYAVVLSIWQVMMHCSDAPMIADNQRDSIARGDATYRAWHFASDRTGRGPLERALAQALGCVSHHPSCMITNSPAVTACRLALLHCVRSMFCACYGCLFSLFIEVLAACHCCLVCKGVTTKEWVSHSLHRVYLINLLSLAASLRALLVFMATYPSEIAHTSSYAVNYFGLFVVRSVSGEPLR